MSSTKATLKDVRYALQFGNERLMQTFGGKAGGEWSLSGTGRPVDRRVAEKFMASPECLPGADMLLGQMSQSYGWRH